MRFHSHPVAHLPSFVVVATSELYNRELAHGCMQMAVGSIGSSAGIPGTVTRRGHQLTLPVGAVRDLGTLAWLFDGRSVWLVLNILY